METNTTGSIWWTVLGDWGGWRGGRRFFLVGYRSGGLWRGRMKGTRRKKQEEGKEEWVEEEEVIGRREWGMEEGEEDKAPSKIHPRSWEKWLFTLLNTPLLAWRTTGICTYLIHRIDARELNDEEVQYAAADRNRPKRWSMIWQYEFIEHQR